MPTVARYFRADGFNRAFCPNGYVYGDRMWSPHIALGTDTNLQVGVADPSIPTYPFEVGNGGSIFGKGGNGSTLQWYNPVTGGQLSVGLRAPNPGGSLHWVWASLKPAIVDVGADQRLCMPTQTDNASFRCIYSVYRRADFTIYNNLYACPAGAISYDTNPVAVNFDAIGNVWCLAHSSDGWFLSYGSSAAQPGITTGIVNESNYIPLNGLPAAPNTFICNQLDNSILVFMTDLSKVAKVTMDGSITVYQMELPINSWMLFAHGIDQTGGQVNANGGILCRYFKNGYLFLAELSAQNFSIIRNRNLQYGLTLSDGSALPVNSIGGSSYNDITNRLYLEINGPAATFYVAEFDAWLDTTVRTARNYFVPNTYAIER